MWAEGLSKEPGLEVKTSMKKRANGKGEFIVRVILT